MVYVLCLTKTTLKQEQTLRFLKRAISILSRVTSEFLHLVFNSECMKCILNYCGGLISLHYDIRCVDTWSWMRGHVNWTGN